MPFREDLLNPIPGDNPSGANLRYAPAYDQIREARREEDDAEQGVWQRQLKAADWPLVVKLASEALAKKSKDLQIGAWLTEAAIHREGFAGLRQGLDLLRGLLGNFWDTVYPEIEDGDLEMRATPLNWVASQLDLPLRRVPLTREGHDWFRYKESLTVPGEQDASQDENKQQLRRAAMEDGKLTPEDWGAAFEATPREYYNDLSNQIQQCKDSLAALDECCTERFAGDAPSFLSMRGTLEEVGNTVRILLLKKGGPIAESTEPEPEEEEVVSAAISDAGQGAAAAAAPARVPRAKVSLTAEPEDAGDAAARVAAVARWFRAQDCRNPVPFLLLRALRWGELRANPHDLDWRLLEAPPTEVRQNIKRLSQEGDYQQLVEAAEEVMATPSGRAWLDLQRFVLGACDSQGYDAVSRALRSEIKALLADYPQLLEASLNDDTQAANAQTREMFQPPPPPPVEEAEQPAVAQFSAPIVEAAHVNGETAAPDDEELIREAIRAGRTNEAVELVSQRLTQETTGRARFQRKTQLAMVCMASGHEAVAYPILRELAGEIAERHLEAWESPGMIAHTLSLFYRCLARVSAPAEERQRVYADICRLDPKRALELER